MAGKKISEEEKLLTAYIEGMKMVKKRLQKDGLLKISDPDEKNLATCRCCVETLGSVSHLRLDRENIQSTLGLALLFGRVLAHDSDDRCPTIFRTILTPPPLRNYNYPLVLSNIHLQWNNLEKVEGLEVLANTLRVLSLSHNKISRIEDSAVCLRALPKLGLLDLSNNNIDRLELDPLPFPPNLVILDLRGNNVCRPATYQDTLLEKLPKLLNLDGEDYNNDETDEESPNGAEKATEMSFQHSDHVSRISSDASNLMAATMDAIIERSRARVEATLNKMATPRGTGRFDQQEKTEEEEPDK